MKCPYCGSDQISMYLIQDKYECLDCGYIWQLDTQNIENKKVAKIFHLKCPGCHKSFNVPQLILNQKYQCPYCYHIFVYKICSNTIEERLQYKESKIISKDYFTDILIDLYEVGKEDVAESGEIK